MRKDYDVLVIGGGLAGMTASIFSARYGLATGMIEQMIGGASIINLEKIENFPGFPQGISGSQLAPSIQEQVMGSGAEFLMAEAAGISIAGQHKIVATDSEEYQAKVVILAAGSTLRKLGIPGEEEYYGRGVSHCATCDGPMYMSQVVGVVGGGDSAADEALTLTEYAERVLVFHRRDQLRAQKALQDRLKSNRKIEIFWNTTVQKVIGEAVVSGVKVKNVVTNLENVIELTGLFVYVGLEPNSSIVRDLVDLDGAGHVPVNISMETPVPGLFAAGDIRQHSVAQLVSSAGDGATAAINAFKYIRSRSW